MKFLIPIILLLFNINLFSQSPFHIDSLSKKVTFTKVLDVKGTKKENILKAKEWFAHYYNSANNIIQFFSEDNGKIIGKSNVNVVHNLASIGDIKLGSITYTITILSKDDKIKYIISDFYHEGKGHCPDYGAYENMINSEKNPLTDQQLKTYSYYTLKIDEVSKSIISSLINYLTKPSDW